jgi:hypothetical protein
MDVVDDASIYMLVEDRRWTPASTRKTANPYRPQKALNYWIRLAPPPQETIFWWPLLQSG